VMSSVFLVKLEIYLRLSPLQAIPKWIDNLLIGCGTAPEIPKPAEEDRLQRDACCCVPETRRCAVR
jgi:hypothetical protein